MSAWPSAKAKRFLAALLRIGWSVKRQSGSHLTLSRADWPDFVFAFHDQEESALACWPESPSTQVLHLAPCSSDRLQQPSWPTAAPLASTPDPCFPSGWHSAGAAATPMLAVVAVRGAVTAPMPSVIDDRRAVTAPMPAVIGVRGAAIGSHAGGYHRPRGSNCPRAGGRPHPRGSDCPSAGGYRLPCGDCPRLDARDAERDGSDDSTPSVCLPRPDTRQALALRSEARWYHRGRGGQE
jgi:predicted RNA binding protein YcfA (HicA-like mRNA interferase family)